MRAWWQTRTLRFRLAAWYAAGGTLLLAAFSATVYWFVEYHMARPLDHQLQRDLVVVRSNLKVLPDGRLFWRDKDIGAVGSWPSSNPWFELWDEEGRLVRRYWPFVDSRLEQLPVAPVRDRETISVFSISQDVRLRVLSTPLQLEGPASGWMIRVMCIHEPAMNALRALLVIIGIALPVVVVLLVLGGYAVTRRWLKPLDLMVQEANRITASDLSRRLPAGNPHDELGRLAGVFNTTLSRLEDSFLALDRFVADASHELLTPLTTLRSVGEVGLRGARSATDYREIIASMLEEAQRLQLLVEKLLQLARAEGGGTSMVEFADVSVERLVRECVEDATILAEEKEQRIELRSCACDTRSDALLLRQAVQNVLDNAIKYSPRKSRILVTVSEASGVCEITVEDEGPGVPPEQQGRLTDRFFRVDNARVTKGGGFGLGLAITKAYMRILGGELGYEDRKPRGSRFQLRVPKLPASPELAPAPAA